MTIERQNDEHGEQSFGDTSRRTVPQSTTRNHKRNPVFFTIVCIAVAFVLDFTAFLSLPPQTRIFEDIVCRNYYHENDPDRFESSDPIPEDQCKSSEVQGELAFVRGLAASFAAIPSLLVSIPYGRLADSPKIGRKPVLLLSMFGIVLDALWTVVVCLFPHVFSLRAIWFGAVFLFIGGGLAVTTAVVITMVTDVIDPENRATVFFQTALAPVVARLLASPLSSWMMEHSGPWLTYLLSTGCFTLAVPLLYLLPETVHLRPPKTTNSLGNSSYDGTRISKHKSRLPAFVHDFLKSISFLTEDRTLLVILAIMFLTTIGRNPLELLLQYVSTRYNIRLSKAAFTFTIFAAVNIVLLVFILPGISRYLTTKRQYAAESKDFWMSKTSIIFLTLGFFVLGLAPNIPIMSTGLVLNTLGNGFNALCLSLISAFVDSQHAARLYSVVCLVGTAGTSLGSPLVAALYDAGLRIGPGWTGLPFLGCGVLHVLAAIVLWSVRLPARLCPSSEPATEGDALEGEVEAAPLLLLEPESDR